MTASTPSPMLKAALAYGRAGLKVFPILELTKDEPLVKWGGRATDNAEQIAAWWSRWPNANIGCATGSSGLVVIDTDMKPDGTGEDTLRTLPSLTPTRMARTPSGGVHRFYWDLVGDVASTRGKIGPRVDTRGVGGYVLLPPSRTPRGRYVWIDRRIVVDVDAWVVEACAASKIEAASQEPVIDWDMPVNVEWARQWLANDAPVSIEGQGGDDTVVKRVVPVLKDHGISEETAGELLAEIWNGRCDPPWLLGDCDPRDNLYTKVHNGFLYCRDTRPGSHSAVADFANAPLPTADEMRPHLEQMAVVRRYPRRIRRV